MSRLLFLLLFVACAALGAHIWLSEQAERPSYAARERNRDEIRVVAVTPPVLAAQRSQQARQSVAQLAGAACVEFSGIIPSEATRAHDAFVAMQLGDRLTERRVEEITRHWVYMPAARDRRTAEATLADLRKKGLTDMSIRPDNAISLGVFSTEEGARRFLDSLEAKGVKGAEQGPFARDLRELVMLVRAPDSEVLSRMVLLQRELANTQLRAVPCPAA